MENVIDAADTWEYFFAETLALEEPRSERLAADKSNPELRAENESGVPMAPAAQDVANQAEVDILGAMSILLVRLEEVESELQAASYTIGFLQSELEEHKDRVKLLPDLEAQTVKLAEAEKQNQELRQIMPELEKSGKQLAQLQSENDDLRLQLEEFYTRRAERQDVPWKLLSWQFWKEFLFRSRRNRNVKPNLTAEGQISRYNKRLAYLDARREPRSNSGPADRHKA